MSCRTLSVWTTDDIAVLLWSTPAAASAPTKRPVPREANGTVQSKPRPSKATCARSIVSLRPAPKRLGLLAALRLGRRGVGALARDALCVLLLLLLLLGGARPRGGLVLGSGR